MIKTGLNFCEGATHSSSSHLQIMLNIAASLLVSRDSKLQLHIFFGVRCTLSSLAKCVLQVICHYLQDLLAITFMVSSSLPEQTHDRTDDSMGYGLCPVRLQCLRSMILHVYPHQALQSVIEQSGGRGFKLQLQSQYPADSPQNGHYRWWERVSPARSRLHSDRDQHPRDTRSPEKTFSLLLCR